MHCVHISPPNLVLLCMKFNSILSREIKVELKVKNLLLLQTNLLPHQIGVLFKVQQWQSACREKYTITILAYQQIQQHKLIDQLQHMQQYFKAQTLLLTNRYTQGSRYCNSDQYSLYSIFSLSITAIQEHTNQLTSKRAKLNFDLVQITKQSNLHERGTIQFRQKAFQQRIFYFNLITEIRENFVFPLTQQFIWSSI